MTHYPKSIVDLIESLARFPGIGVKTAERLAMHLLRAPQSQAETLAARVLAIKKETRLCRLCFALSDNELCRICSNPARDGGVVCVVEQPADMASIEKSGAFNGVYHILQGTLSPMDGIGPDAIRIRELLQRIAGGKIREVILATGTSIEGEATADYIADQLRDQSLKVTRIASGVPVGGDLKYVDQVTLKRALDSRRDVGKGGGHA